MSGRLFIRIAAGLLLLASARPAQTSGILRFGGTLFQPTNERSLVQEGSFSAGPNSRFFITDELEVEAAEALSGFVSYEHKLTERFGVELSATHTATDIELRGTRTTRVEIHPAEGGETEVRTSSTDLASNGDLDLTEVTIGLNVHFGKRDKADFYAGPFVGYVFFGESIVDDLEGKVTDEVVVGATAGVEIPLRSGKWTLSAAIRYTAMEAGPAAVRRIVVLRGFEDPLGLDPVGLRVGLGRRF